MSTLTVNTLISAILGGLVAAVVTVVMDYRKTRRRELLDAYSRWFEALQSTLRDARAYYDFGAKFGPEWEIARKREKEAVDRANAQAQQGAPLQAQQFNQQMLDRIRQPVAEGYQVLIRLAEQTVGTETRLFIAAALVRLVEARVDFLDHLQDLTALAVRDETTDATETPAHLPGHRLTYLKKSEPLAQVRIGQFMARVINAHRFRGFWARAAKMPT